MKIICITGIDGAGKTTLARNLVSILRKQDQPATYVYGRTYPLISRLLMSLGRALILRKHNQWHDYPAYNNSKKKTMRHPLLRWVYTIAIYMDYYTQIWLKLLPNLFSQRMVVLDRFIYDTVISDLTVHLGYSSTETANAIEHGLRLLPFPIMTVLIDLPEEVAFLRKNDMPHIDYLRERRCFYLELKQRPEVEILDGENTPQFLVQSMLGMLSSIERGVLVS